MVKSSKNINLLQGGVISGRNELTPPALSCQRISVPPVNSLKTHQWGLFSCTHEAALPRNGITEMSGFKSLPGTCFQGREMHQNTPAKLFFVCFFALVSLQVGHILGAQPPSLFLGDLWQFASDKMWDYLCSLHFSPRSKGSADFTLPAVMVFNI